MEGVSLHSSLYQACSIFSVFHFQPLPLLCIMDGIVRNSFLCWIVLRKRLSSPILNLGDF